MKRIDPTRYDRKTRVITRLAASFLNIWFSTCRVEILGEEHHDRYITGPDKVVGATWHRGAIFLVWFYGPVHPMIMFSRSKDGDLLAGFAQRLGVVPVRGSSKRGGAEALEIMRSFLMKPGPFKAATVLDGPRGPARVAKKGMIVLAGQSGVPLLPIAVSANPAIVFRSAWDRTVVPLPFSRVVVSYRRPWMIPDDIDEKGLEDLRGQVEITLNEMTDEVDAITGLRP